MRSFTTCVVFGILLCGITSCAAPPASVETPAPIEEPTVQPTTDESKDQPTILPTTQDRLVALGILEDPAIASEVEEAPTVDEDRDFFQAALDMMDTLDALILVEPYRLTEEGDGKARLRDAVKALISFADAYRDCREDFRNGADPKSIADRMDRILIAINRWREVYLVRWVAFQDVVPDLPQGLEKAHERFRTTSEALYDRAADFKRETVERFYVPRRPKIKAM